MTNKKVWLMRLKDALNNMFGFVLTQPIHLTLRQMRIVSIVAVCFCGWLLFDMWQWYKLSADINKGGDVAFWGFAAAMLGAFWKAIDNITAKHGKDD